MSSSSFKVRDLVWAKMNGFPPWPGIIVNPPQHMPKRPKPGTKKNAIFYCILFFGTKDYGWSHNVVHYGSMSKKNINKKSIKFLKACKDAEKYIATKDDSIIFPPGHVQSDEIYYSSDSEVVCSSSDQSSSESDSDSSDDELVWKFIVPNENKTNTNGNSNPGSEEIEMPIVTEEKMPINILPLVDMSIPPSCQKKNLTPMKQTVGIIGLGAIGSGIVKNLIYAKYNVVIWNRTYEKTKPFAEAGATIADSPKMLADSADIILSCLADEKVLQEVFYGRSYSGTIKGITEGKIYVEMTIVKPEISRKLQTDINNQNGKYMECFCQGGKSDAENGTLTLLCGANNDLYKELKPMLDTISSKHSHLSANIGPAYISACSMLTLAAAQTSSLTQFLSNDDINGIPKETLYDIYERVMPSFIVKNKKQNLLTNNHKTEHKLKHYHKGILGLVDNGLTNNSSLEAINSLNDHFKLSLLMKLGDEDLSSLISVKKKSYN